MHRPLITLLTDFGLRDHYVAAMKGVMLGICPEARFVDITHQVEAFAIPQAAWTLSHAWECFPAGTVHLVVVDPGVGSLRRPLAARAGGHFFVGPDNGVLAPVLDRDPQRGAYEINVREYTRKPASNTFHGRDLFSPVAAHLAAGLDIEKIGMSVSDYVRFGYARPTLTEPGCWTGTIVSIDHFGNIVTNLDWDSFHTITDKPFELRIEGRAITTYCRSYTDAAALEYFVIKGSTGFLEVSLNQDDAAKRLNVRPGISINFRLY